MALAINRENDLIAPPTGAEANPSAKKPIKALAASSPTLSTASVMSGGMLIPPPIQVPVATKPVDFRKGMDGLAAPVKQQLKAVLGINRGALQFSRGKCS